MNRKLEWKRIREVLLVVVIPAIIILVSLYKGGIYPFGDKTLIYHDMQYQYIDFFMWFHDVLHGKAAIGYSFAAGLGSNTIALVAYYLSSPLNLLVYFVQQENMAGFLTFLICLKMLLCSVTVYIYVKKRFNLSSIYVILLGISYSFTGYNVLQCSNIMWLDGVIILPLIALGIYKMLWEGKKKIYFWALFYAVFSNWYIGYMLCLFSVLYFIFESIVYYWECGTKLKEFIRNIINFALTSILSVLATSFLFYRRLFL